MRKDVRIALDDARDFSELASNNTNKVANRVIASLYIRSVIRGNDALCLHFLNERPQRHGQAASYFAKLYEDNHIDEKYSRYTKNITTLDGKKSEVEYKSSSISSNELERIKKQAERFRENVVEELLDDAS